MAPRTNSSKARCSYPWRSFRSPSRNSRVPTGIRPRAAGSNDSWAQCSSGSAPRGSGVWSRRGAAGSAALRSGFHRAEASLRVLAFGLPLLYLNFGLTHFLVARDMERATTWLALMMLMVSVTLDVALIPRWSGPGAACATVLAEVALSVGCLAALTSGRLRAGDRHQCQEQPEETVERRELQEVSSAPCTKKLPAATPKARPAMCPEAQCLRRSRPSAKTTDPRARIPASPRSASVSK